MKILYIVTQADGGGAQKYTLALAKHFGGELAAGTEANKLFNDAKTLGIPYFTLKHLKRNIHPWHDLLAIWEIRRLVKLHRPDIVHLNSSKAGVLGSFACIWLKTKTVFTAHGFIFNEPLPSWLKAFYLALEKTASDFRDYIITVSNADKNSALYFGLIKESKISTIHNGIGQINFLPRDDAKKQLSLPTYKFIFGTIANFYKTKGLDILIDAVSKLADDIKSKCQFIIIGHGPEFENCKLKIENLGLGKIILTPGNIADAARYLKSFDCFIIPSRKEGFSYTLLEAMQAGLPIIATDVGGNKEAVDNAGVLVPADNAEKLAYAITSIFSSAEERISLSKKALERSKLFTEQKMLEETKKVYEKVLLK